ncbi:hypothetical protein BAE44_0001773, partial [Dichanthelium oligosanthes]
LINFGRLSWPLLEQNSQINSTVMICMLWNIWKCRSARVCKHEDESNLKISRW